MMLHFRVLTGASVLKVSEVSALQTPTQIHEG